MCVCVCVLVCVCVCVCVHEALACVEVYICVSPLNVMPFHYLAQYIPISSSTNRKMPRISLLVHLRRRRLNVLSGISLVEEMDPEDGCLKALRKSLITEHIYDVRRST